MPITGLCTYIVVFNLDTIALVLNQTNSNKTRWRNPGGLLGDSEAHPAKKFLVVVQFSY